MSATTSATKPALWSPGDWNAFFGFGTNILVNMLTLTALLRFVLKMPDAIVFGRILPALGLMMCLSTFYYAFLAYRLAKRTGRSDVCALPSGVSVPHMFVVTFVIMLPITLKTGDAVKGWQAGGRFDHLHIDAPGLGNVHDANDWYSLLCHNPRRLVWRRSLSPRHSGWTDRHRSRHAHCLGLDPGRP